MFGKIGVNGEYKEAVEAQIEKLRELKKGS